MIIDGVVSYRNSTSNHNCRSGELASRALYLIEILHQTTTAPSMFYLAAQLYLIEILHQTTTLAPIIILRSLLYLIEILHQTTTARTRHRRTQSCILSKFYIKPQLSSLYLIFELVVSYRNSTSNHNQSLRRNYRNVVVSYRNSTSNHNSASFLAPRDWVVSYRNSTSNHNSSSGNYIQSSVVSYRNSTSNHNSKRRRPIRR